jgi:hypothetical protein
MNTPLTPAQQEAARQLAAELTRIEREHTLASEAMQADPESLRLKFAEKAAAALIQTLLSIRREEDPKEVQRRKLWTEIIVQHCDFDLADTALREFDRLFTEPGSQPREYPKRDWVHVPKSKPE